MKSHVTPSFRKLYSALPLEIREQSRAAYRVFRGNPRHPSLHFKKIHTTEPIVSVRISRGYRAVGRLEGSDTVVWFWIGPHEQYEKLVSMR